MRCLLGIFLSWVVAWSVFSAEVLRINEFAAGGRQGLIDENGDSPDWIEVQNISPQAVDLKSWSFEWKERSWSFPATNLPAGDFLVIFASGKDRTTPGTPLHTSFKLSANGGTLTLRGPDGSVSAVENYPPQIPGVSFGRSTGKDVKLPSSRSTHTYLKSPTPGQTNSSFIAPGPHILSLTHHPTVPKLNESILVKTKVSLPESTTRVRLRYRIMFDAEVEMPMHDDGEHQDGIAHDGTYAASIPANAAKSGQMIRYYVLAEDDRGASRWPLFARRNGYSAYQGTVIADPSVQSKLPLMHLFEGAGVVLAFEGELYDNMIISKHGQISQGFPKPSLNLRFPVDHRFRAHKDLPRVSEVKILGNFADKSKIRNTLAYEAIAAAGSVGHFASPVRLQRNGQFYCVAEMVEDGDDRWLERVGRDPEGALYKMYSSLTPNPDFEKKTRKSEGARDLSTLAAALAENRPLAQRVAYAYDHLDIPQCISYFVALTLISSGDHGHKNYYLYRDTRGSGEWALFPWDVDLSWGRNWTGQYFNDQIFVDNPLNLYRAGRTNRARNPLYNLFFESPDFRRMYLRRLRTVMDELLQPPNTPPSALILEKRIRELIDLVDPREFGTSDAALDSAGWPGWSPERTAREEAQRIITQYLPGRRNFLFSNARAQLWGDLIPESQPEIASLRVSQPVRSAQLGEQFICITNQNAFAVDITLWKLSGAGIHHQFRTGTVIPPGNCLFVVADVREFRRRQSPATDKRPRFVQGNWIGTLKTEGTLQLTDHRGRIVPSGPTRTADQN